MNLDEHDLDVNLILLNSVPERATVNAAIGDNTLYQVKNDLMQLFKEA